jgi:hypothetical protein
MSSSVDVNLVKKGYSKDKYSKKKIEELMKCMEDPIYFCENFVMVQHPSKGRMPFVPYEYQRRLISTYANNRFSIALLPRQTGKTTCAMAYLLWRAMFMQDQTILIVANKGAAALEIMKRIRFGYEELPDYIRAGVTTYNKGSIEFDNGSIIVARATTPDAARGMSISLLYCDEFAFVAPGMAKEFWASIRPTLAEGGGCIITSTPNNDEDEFAQIWRGANRTQDEYGIENPDGVGENGFKAIKVDWWEHPERDEEWAKRERAALGEERWLREYCCEFVSFDETLISSIKLQDLQGTEPVETLGTVRWYSKPEPNKTYMVGLDPALGTGGDYAAIQVFSAPELKQVAEWRHNKTDTKGQIRILLQILRHIDYELRNHPAQKGEPEIYWSVENNTLGEAALIVINDTGEEYFPGIFVHEPKRRGVARRVRKGLNTTNKTKVTACMKMKSLIESDRLRLFSKPLVRELKNYIAKGMGFEAKQGETDDLVSGTLIAVRILQIIQSWDPDLEENLKEAIDLDEEDIAPMPVSMSFGF